MSLRRAFSTSLSRSADSRPAINAFLNIPGSQEQNEPKGKQHNASRLALRAMALATAPVQEEGKRKTFETSMIIPPKRLSNDDLYHQRYIRNARPLIGPKAAIARHQDPFHLSKRNPLDEAMNPRFVYGFVDGLGRIRNRSETGLTLKSQKMVAKMVRRARAMGIVAPLTKAPKNIGLGALEAYEAGGRYR